MPWVAKGTNTVYIVTRWDQGRSQPHSPGWARVPLSSFLPQTSINFSYFSSNIAYFLPHFGLSGGRVAHPGRPWLRRWMGQDAYINFQVGVDNFEIEHKTW